MESQIERSPRRGCLGRVGKFLLALIILIGIIPAAYLTLWGLGGLLVVADPLEKVSTIAVLSGDEVIRFKEALHLLRDGYAPLVILTETANMPGGGNSLNLVEKIILARQMGIASEAILVTKSTATSTRDESQAILAVAQQRKFNSIIVVTDPYHCFRARLLFRSAFAGSGIKVIVRPARDHWYKSATWMLSSEGWRATMSEYVKLFGILIGIRGD